jgi:DNA-binding HxlR family transcriptional regulator
MSFVSGSCLALILQVTFKNKAARHVQVASTIDYVNFEAVTSDDQGRETSIHPNLHGVDEPSKSCDQALAQAFKFLGKRWNGVILGTLTNGTSGFAELRRNVTGISDSVLSERLSELHAAGLITRVVDPGPPVAVTYQLSDTGTALIPAMHALSAWAAENFPGDGDHA